jgi:hypothetical protein
MGVRVITTVIQAASSYNLVDLATIKAELKITDAASDAYLTGKLGIVSSMIASYCNRVFAQETVQDLFYPEQSNDPYWSLGDFSPLQLARWPVSAVNSITLQPDVDPSDNILLTAGLDYVLDGANGQVIRLSEYSGYAMDWCAIPLTVQYVAGFTTIPGDLQQAALDMITAQFYARGRDPNMKRSNQVGGVGEIEFWVPNTPQGSFPPTVRELLDNKYRPPTIAR